MALVRGDILVVVVVWLLAVIVEGVDAVEIHRESVLQMVGM